ncbi:hypothetical protein IJS77_04315 [bacterium]|nr:hypothetical protein [bacterium]
MEDKKIVLEEAFKCMFKKGWLGKFLGIILLLIPISLCALIMEILKNITFHPATFIGFFLIHTVGLIIGFIIYGYFVLYAHDRALDKNAELRELPGNMFASFLVGIKTPTGLIINIIVLHILYIIIVGIPLFLINSLLTKLSPVIGIVISIILLLVVGVAFTVLMINFLGKLYAHYVKDLNLISWFQWRKALAFNKDLHFGKLNIFLAILCTIGAWILYGIVGIIIMIPVLISAAIIKNAIVLVVLFALIGIISVFVNYFILMFWSNIFGQYTYNAIEHKIGKSPEILPKSINPDTLLTMIIAITLITLNGVSYLFIMNSPSNGITFGPTYSYGTSNGSYNNTGTPQKQYFCSFINEEGTSIGTIYTPGVGPLRDCNDSFFIKTPEERMACIRDNILIEKMYKNGECEEVKTDDSGTMTFGGGSDYNDSRNSGPIGDLIDRQSNLAALIKIKKAISNYESVAYIYMEEKSTPQKKVKDLKGLAGQNCENLDEYFKIVNRNDSCSFTTADGIYWEFNPNTGEVTVSDSYDNPTYTLQMGVCEDGTVNCSSRYPEVSQMMNKTS